MEEDINLQLTVGTAEALCVSGSFCRKDLVLNFQVCAELKCESCSKGRASAVRRVHLEALSFLMSLCSRADSIPPANFTYEKQVQR